MKCHRCHSLYGGIGNHEFYRQKLTISYLKNRFSSACFCRIWGINYRGGLSISKVRSDLTDLGAQLCEHNTHPQAAHSANLKYNVLKIVTFL